MAYTYSDILSGIYSDIPSDIFSGILYVRVQACCTASKAVDMARVHWCPQAEELHLFKSRDPHLAGNKNKAFRPFRKPQAGKKS
jgi:hypothetical protein